MPGRCCRADLRIEKIAQVRIFVDAIRNQQKAEAQQAQNSHRHLDLCPSKAIDALKPTSLAYSTYSITRTNRMNFTPIRAALSLAILLVLNHPQQATAHYSRRSASASRRRTTNTFSSRRRVVPSIHQDFELEGLSFLNERRSTDDGTDDVRTIQPCRSIGNTLLRGACLRIASDLSVSCLFSFPCMRLLSRRISDNYAFIVSCVLTTYAGRNSSRKHQDSR